MTTKKVENSRISKNFFFLKFYYGKNFAGIRDMFMNIYVAALVFYIFWHPASGFCLDPKEVLVVANSRVQESVEIARYYMAKRSIPETNFLSVQISTQETMSREEYDSGLRDKVLKKLSCLKSQSRIAAIVLVYGIPLKVSPPGMNVYAKEILQEYKEKRKTIESDKQVSDTERKEDIDFLKQKIDRLLRRNSRASVDSELALAKVEEYNLDGWIKNPYFLGFKEETLSLSRDQVLLVSRLDGVDPATVYRIINDTLRAEKKGLTGKAYFDARWPNPSTEKELSGYKRYDLSLHRAALVVEQRMEVILDDKEELFEEKCCPETALYGGWYSLAKYIDSFSWQVGAIGYHIASAECSSLRSTEQSLWCPKMLEQGVAATIGPVYEPYVQGFPLPEIFFSHLVGGNLSLGECYLVSVPYLSWQMVLVGDPLYQPFAPLN